MTPKQVINHFGSIKEAAAGIGMTVQAIYKWDDQGYIPYPSQVIIQLVTDGKLTAVKK